MSRKFALRREGTGLGGVGRRSRSASRAIQLDFTHDALLELTGAALKQKLGARALRAIIEKVMHPILFAGPERAGERVVVDVVEADDVRRAVAAIS